MCNLEFNSIRMTIELLQKVFIYSSIVVRNILEFSKI
jgi:hypothetical protein